MRTELDNAKYISLATFKKDGTRVASPVWLVGSDGTYRAMTEADSWKVKRIRNDPRVEMAVSDVRGRVSDDATTYKGTASIVDGDEAAATEAAIWDKYGLMGKVVTLPMKVKRLVTRQPEPERVGLELTIDV